MRTQVQGKREHKQTINKTQVKTLCKRTYGYEMTINDNKEDLKQKNYHLSQIDK